MRIPRVRVDVEYIPQKNNLTSVDFGDTYAKGSGVQNSSYPNELSTVSMGQDIFLLGRSILGTGAVYWDKYDGYLSTILSSDTLYDVTDSSKGYKIGKKTDGTLVSSLKMTITSRETIKQLVLFFDSVVYEFPVVLKVNGEEFINNGTRFAWVDSEYAGKTLEVEFLSWNKPDVALRLTGVVDGLTISYDKYSGLVDLDVQFQSTASEMPEYGCTGKVDSFTVLDDNYYIHSLAEMDLLKKDLAIRVYFGDKLISKYTSTADWEETGKKITVTMEDEIMRWDEIAVNLTDEDKGDNLNEYLINVLMAGGVNLDDDGVVGGRLKYGYWKTENGVDLTMKDYLRSIKLGLWFRPQQGSLKKELNKICTLAQCNIFIGVGNKIEISRD